ncbi:MAG: ribosome assembly RNA-binding protein YhbY [Eubacterium sp.]|nr:ribosome assembly RNA-binding protein YhbY [Eubacterium sp.]
MDLTSKQRVYLKSLSGKIEPIFQIGKSSLTPSITDAIDDALEKRELVKISVLKNCFDDPKELAAIVAERTHANVVQVIGKRFILYRPSKKAPKIELPAAN